MIEIALSLIVLPSIPPASFAHEPCLANFYYGDFGGHSIFVPPVSCIAFDVVSALGVDEGHISLLPEDTLELVWVQEMAVEESLRIPPDEAQSLIEEGVHSLLMMEDERVEQIAMQQADEQTILGGGEDDDDEGGVIVPKVFGIEVLHRTPTSYLFALRGFDRIVPIDQILPPTYKAYSVNWLPSAPEAVAPERLAHLRALLSDVKYDATVAALVESLSAPQMTEDVRYLTGERKDSPIKSRHSFHPDTLIAAEWIKTQIEGTGANCELRTFLDGFAPNIVCQYDGLDDTTGLVMFSAHYDSRGSFGRTRAPGGDDDGSGTTAIISVARAIGKNGVKFRSNVQLVLFAGEEQGLYGSRAYSRELQAQDANITLMVQADMLAYHVPGEAPQLGLPERIGTPEVAQLLGNMSYLYSPELEVGFSPACCSDHQSFWEKGYASSQLFERAGPIADPMYHNSGDLSDREGYDITQLRSIAKVQLATLLHAAGFELQESK